MPKKKPETWYGKLWYFIWDDDSALSWIVNVVLAFLLIKFIVYPGLGFLLGTTHPVVAVVSGSMEHIIRDGKVCGIYPDEYSSSLEGWWRVCGDFYYDYNITFDDFRGFTLKNGFNKGDIIVLLGVEPKKIKIGDIIVFKGSKADPIIHRVVEIEPGESYVFTTKGDHNPGFVADDLRIQEDEVIGRAIFKIPLLGYIKIWFVEILRFTGLPGLIGVFNAR